MRNSDKYDLATGKAVDDWLSEGRTATQSVSNECEDALAGFTENEINVLRQLDDDESRNASWILKHRETISLFRERQLLKGENTYLTPLAGRAIRHLKIIGEWQQ
ncbi:hypothetical protein [Shimia sediminis]|uniref:hypothetical protein n=1 Tax=Shimia sediminis TaxID=2497945 RepID=UPI000F8CEBEC|nr:hypothetical protein [Shimia sediminis]